MKFNARIFYLMIFSFSMCFPAQSKKNKEFFKVLDSYFSECNKKFTTCVNLKKINDLLQDVEVDVNIQDSHGRTALMIASGFHNMELIKLLLNHPGIDVNKVDNNRDSAISHFLMLSLEAKKKVVRQTLESLLLLLDKDIIVTDYNMKYIPLSADKKTLKWLNWYRGEYVLYKQNYLKLCKDNLNEVFQGIAGLANHTLEYCNDFKFSDFLKIKEKEERIKQSQSKGCVIQ